jgi:Universal stress protein family
MTMRNLLIPIFEGIEFDNQLSVALDIAHPFKSHINAVFIRPDPESAFANLPSVIAAAGMTAAEIDREGRKSEASAHSYFDVGCKEKRIGQGQRNDLVATIVATWSERIGPLESIIARLGRLSDLIIVNRPAYESCTGRAFDTAVFETGRPTLVLPRYVPAGILNHIVIAWNGSLEAARAVAGAMPLLHKAKQISVFSALEEDADADPDLDLIGPLKWHRINAALLRPTGGEVSIGAELLKVAGNQSATMVVMGAYTHSRVRQMLLGGVTRHILRNGTLPVLMAH